MRWGLDRTLRMLADAGNPHLRFRTLHVGGTNGKGSVAAHLEAALRAAGHRTGLYSSPHLCTFRERIRIDGRPITEAALLDAARRLWPAIRREQPSFFEATTAIAFLALADAGVDVAVVEVGLGGRLDSTNVIRPEVAVLTNVSLDHVQLLGPTVLHVAREKAGIIKPGVPLVTGETAGTAAEVFRDAARTAGAPMRALAPGQMTDVHTGVVGTTFRLSGTGWGTLKLHSALPGAHQATNAALAALALDVAGDLRPGRDALARGFAEVEWPGRLDVQKHAGVTWLFDVAHNVAGVESLVAALPSLSLPRPWTALVGVLGDKDWAGMLQPLCSAVDRLILTEPSTAPVERRWDLLQAADAVHGAAACEPSFAAALAGAHAAGGTVIVTGSFHTVGDAMSALGLCRDGADHVVDGPRLQG